MRAASVRSSPAISCTKPILQLNIVISFRLDDDFKDTLVKEIVNDDLIVSAFDIVKAAPLNAFV